MDKMDMITITRAQFQEAVQYCLDAFKETRPDSISKEMGELLNLVCTGWAVGLELHLFGDEDDDEDVMPFN